MLEVTGIYKSFGGTAVLRGISFSVTEGETICLLGASGSGKSTLLHILAGLEIPDKGRLNWDGKDLAPVPAHRRSFGLVFQDYALFPHLDVMGNVEFGLKMLGLSDKEIEPRVTSALKKVGLNGYEHRRVTDLSGGEQQRVALARALAPNPHLLMFDEPLGALDRNLREQLMGDLREILHTTRVPAIYVTHDQDEAFFLADRILLLNEGEIILSGTPEAIWANPGSTWAARFLDIGNILEGVVISHTQRYKIETRVGRFEINCGHAHKIGAKVHLLIRPQGSVQTLDGNMQGLVSDVIFHKDQYKIVLTNQLYFYSREPVKIGEEIHFQLPASAIACLP